MSRIFKSIRWRLQLWYGAILVLVLIGFGVTSYQLERARQFRNADEQLQRQHAFVSAFLRPRPQRERFPGPPERQGPGMPRNFPPEAIRPERMERIDRPPQRLHELLQIPLQSPQFAATNQRPYYFMVWPRGGQPPVRSEAAPEHIPAVRPRDRMSPPMFRTREDKREVWQMIPGGDLVLVGRSLNRELFELRNTAWTLSFIGGTVLLLGLAGGWWISTRAIRPIETISQTASKIADGNLSQRINVAETETELGRLAIVLNSTFARLESAISQQRRFTADAAHELRTPITVILAQIQSALAKPRTAEDYQETLEACQRAAQRMRRLIEALLQLARLESGQDLAQLRVFDLGEIIDESLDFVRPLARQKNICLEANLDRKLIVLGEPQQIGQVLVNLLTNAIQYNRVDGWVKVEGQTDDSTITLKISDSGEGISATDLPHIFERFYKADTARAHSKGGTGLGLSISAAIIRGHGGTIEVQSELGQGAVFVVHLPRAPDPEEQKALQGAGSKR